MSSRSETLNEFTVRATAGVMSTTATRDVTVTIRPGAWDRMSQAFTSGAQRPGRPKRTSVTVTESELVLPSMYAAS